MKICVIGGGLLGITLAHRLSQKGSSVTLLEAGPRIGGLADSWRIGDVEWDRHYHVILASDSYLRRLLRELNLESEIRWKPTQTGFWVDGAMHPFTTPADFLRFPGLNLLDKARLGMTIFTAAQRTDGLTFEKIPVADWLIRWSGRRAFEKFWLPVLRAKLRENYTDTSAAFIWATIRRLFAARRAGIQEQFGYVEGGYRRILDQLQTTLTNEGVLIRPNSPATAVRPSPEGVLVTVNSGPAERFDRVIWTTPAPAIVSACDWLTADEKKRLSGVRYQGIICASMLLKQPLGPYYVTNIGDATIPFTGLIEMSTIVPVKSFGGKSLVYLPKYVDPADPSFNQTDEEIKTTFLAGVTRMYPGFNSEDVEAFRISRVRHVFALPTLNYSQSLPPVRSSAPGVFILNSAHIVNATLNVNETVRLAETHVETIAA